MSSSSFTLAIAACLALGAADLAFVNLRLVPSALSTQTARPATSGTRTTGTHPVGANVPDAAKVVELTDSPTSPTPAPVAALLAEGAIPVASRPRPQRIATSTMPAAATASRWRPRTLYFENNRATLTDESRRILETIIMALNSDREAVVQIEGHADSLGESAVNDLLSSIRAKRVGAYLARRGVAGRRVSITSYGERRPVASGMGADALRRNRRVELRFRGHQP